MPRNQAHREAQQRWWRDVAMGRRRKWFAEHGPCVDCGSWQNLELDHVDPQTKVSHTVWTWRDERREKELEKCAARCNECHKKKTVNDLRNMDVNAHLRRSDPPGMAWCYVKQHFVSLDGFYKNRAKRRGIENECKDCKRERIGESRRRLCDRL